MLWENMPLYYVTNGTTHNTNKVDPQAIIIMRMNSLEDFLKFHPPINYWLLYLNLMFTFMKNI